MTFLSKLIFWTVIVPLALSIASYYAILLFEDYRSAALPKIEADNWWARTERDASPLSKSAAPSDSDVRRFVINASDADLEELKTRLKRAKLLENIVEDHSYGFRGDQLKQIRDYWLHKYDWRQWEREINAMTHYVTQIEGIDVHYALVKPADAGAGAGAGAGESSASGAAKTKTKTKTITLVLLHGWPSTFFEYYKLAQLLNKPASGKSYNGHALQFELIIPSLPGYGWSEGAHKPGMDIVSISRIFLKLLARLDRRAYYVHGGDWGSMVAQTMGRLVADNLFVPQYAGDAQQANSKDNGVQSAKPGSIIKGVHTNFPLMQIGKLSFWFKAFAAWLVPSLFLEPGEYAQLYPLGNRFADLISATGYMHIQATRPDTVAAGLLDSPIGLAAYVLEKYTAWTHRDNLQRADGGLTEKYTLDELLTNVMIYWLSDSIGSSVRLYKESFGRTDPSVRQWFGSPLRGVPIGVAVFPNELLAPPKWFLQDAYPNMVHFVNYPRGGHFPALEEPELLVESIRKFVYAAETYWSSHSSEHHA